jgi:hypothetical protein
LEKIAAGGGASRILRLPHPAFQEQGGKPPVPPDGEDRWDDLDGAREVEIGVVNFG